MKKLVSLFLCPILIFSLASCGVKDAKSKMQIAPSDLSKEEKKILELVDTQSYTGIFDYSVNDEIKSMSVNIFELGEDGKWKSAGGSNGEIKRDGRILVSRAKDGTSIIITVQDEMGIVSWNAPHEQNSKSDKDKKVIKGTSHVWENKSVDIVAEQTIPLGILCETSKNTMRAYGVKSFNDIENLKEYDTVYAVTVVFSKTEL